MIRTQHLFAGFERPTIERLGFLELPLALEHAGQTINQAESTGIVRPQQPLPGFERPTVKRLGFLELPLAIENTREIDEGA